MAIDEKSIVEAVSGLGFKGNEEGLIPAFGLHLTTHFADYYNRSSFAVARAMEGSGLEDDARALLVEAGHICAFNTFGGIMKSAEWDAVVAPMIKTREDWLHGIVAVINAFGWGKWHIERLDPGVELKIRIENSYECTGWLRDYPVSKFARCYLATGGVAGLMNLMYVGDITTRPELTEAYYVELFRGGDAFHAVETSCMARGDAHCELKAAKS
ncbi:MAG: hypothetical protein Q8Q09_09940 [Deltaproteobacteria bacterium]|nr:hypothetical protein [Deltaproteobacteria bacterium]